jgi:hypothetical protein
MIEVESFTKNGYVVFYVKGTTILHREDGPAIIWRDGSESWYFYGKLHRDGGPAYIESVGLKEWWSHGMRHRDDGPAVIHMNGEIEWWLDGDSCNKETWFKNLPEDKKLEQLYSKYFIES